MSVRYERAVEAGKELREPVGLAVAEDEAVETPWGRVLRRFRHNLPAMLALAVILLIAGTALAAPLLAPHDPNLTSAVANRGPSDAHWLGTDSTGRDLASRLVYGARASMQVAFQVVLIATAIALPLGLIAGYFGRWVGAVIMRCMDALFTFPPLTLALAVAALLGRSLFNASLAIAIVFVPGLVRLVRATVLAAREETFVEASRSVGVTSARMVRKHILPNVLSPLIVQAALAFGYAIGAEAGLSFLGFGVQAPAASWGTMLQDGYGNINTTTWPLVPPAIAILVAILCFNLVGDGLRDSFGRETFALEGAP